MRSILAASALACGVLLLSTASSDDAKPVDAAVKGLVTMRGKPPAGTRVFFHLKEGQFLGSRLKDDGTFAIDRVPTGQYTITIEGKDLPKKYAEEKVSGLTVVVQEGKNEFNFELQ